MVERLKRELAETKQHPATSAVAEAIKAVKTKGNTPSSSKSKSLKK